MRLSDYIWSRNPRGMHNKGAFQGIDINRYIQMQAGWIKIVCGGGEFLTQARELVARNCTPIIRQWRPHHGAQPPDEGMYDAWQSYINVGARWIELYNEPNLDGEWPWPDGTGPDRNISWENREGVIAPIMDSWIQWAARIIDMGGYPGFIAFSETEHGRHASLYWLEACLIYLHEAHDALFRDVIANGLWAATHPYLINHFYQEVPGAGPTSARPPEQQRAREPGWHFEYPYDPICQAHDPGRTVWGGTELTPMGDPNGLTAMGWAFQQKLSEIFGMGPVPVVGTEGGIWIIPAPHDPPHVIDDRYPGYNWQSHPEATLACFDWIAQQGPPWMFGLTLYDEYAYYEVYNQTVPAIFKMEAEPVISKNVPDYDTASGNIPVDPWLPQPGPGPIHGYPDYHFIMLAPNTADAWLFGAARSYWNSFRPHILHDPDFIGRFSSTRSLAVTVLATPETIRTTDQTIRDKWPNVKYDPIVGETVERIREQLNWRVRIQERFG